MELHGSALRPADHVRSLIDSAGEQALVLLARAHAGRGLGTIGTGVRIGDGRPPRGPGQVAIDAGVVLLSRARQAVWELHSAPAVQVPRLRGARLHVLRQYQGAVRGPDAVPDADPPRLEHTVP